MKNRIDCFKAEVWVDGSKRDSYTQRFFDRADAEAWVKETKEEIVAFRREDEGPDFSTWRVCSYVVEERITVF